MSFKRPTQKEINNSRINEVVDRIEEELLIAPMRFFKRDEMQGYFDAELKETFGLGDEHIKRMVAKKATFRVLHRTYKGEPALFFTLR